MLANDNEVDSGAKFCLPVESHHIINLDFLNLVLNISKISKIRAAQKGCRPYLDECFFIIGIDKM